MLQWLNTISVPEVVNGCAAEGEHAMSSHWQKKNQAIERATSTATTTATASSMLQRYAGLPPAAFRTDLGPEGAIRTAPSDDNQRHNYCRLNEVLLEVVAHPSTPHRAPHSPCSSAPTFRCPVLLLSLHTYMNGVDKVQCNCCSVALVFFQAFFRVLLVLHGTFFRDRIWLVQ